MLVFLTKEKHIDVVCVKTLYEINEFVFGSQTYVSHMLENCIDVALSFSIIYVISYLFYYFTHVGCSNKNDSTKNT